jgi:formate hydrogenlyase subunit 6/NADH:ubiquinone oxidoreductase subunit I
MYTVAGPDYDVYKKLVEIDLDVCIGCKLCVKYCPWDTIEMIDSGEAFEIAKEWTLRTVMPQKEWLQGEDIESGGFFPTAFNSDRPAGV